MIQKTELKKLHLATSLGFDQETGKIQPMCVLAISDPHCGSRVGLCPQDFMLYDGTVIKQNYIRQRMWEVFGRITRDGLKRIGNRPYLMLLVGDLTEGLHHGRKQIISEEMDDHKRCAIECLSPLAFNKNCVEVLGVKGTPTHVDLIENSILKALGAKPSITNPNEYALDKARFIVNGVLYDASHHISTTSRGYLEAGRASIHLGNLSYNYARDGLKVPQVVIKGHGHTPGFWNNCRQIMIMLGAMQSKTSYGYKVCPDSISYPAIATCINDERGKLPEVVMHGEALDENYTQLFS